MSEVDVNGSLLSSFTDVNDLLHLSLDSDGRVFVAHWFNDRVLLLNTQLQLQRVLIDHNNSQLKLRLPTRLHHDPLMSRLYIVHASSREWPFRSDTISVMSLRWVTDWYHCCADHCVNCLLSNSIIMNTFTNPRVSRCITHSNLSHTDQYCRQL